MPDQNLPADFIEQLKAITKKRPRAVVDHILEHGFVTTEELTTLYGYEHAPRAARDVREEGVPLETFRVKSSSGRSIGAYRFGDLSTVRRDRLGGRVTFSKGFKERLIQSDGSRCAICATAYEPRYLQVDHRVPYEVLGDRSLSDRKIEDYMLLCASCNRAKSWSCEHCENWLVAKEPKICATCYWAFPENYQHIALRPIRRLDLTWSEGETSVYDRIKAQSEAVQEAMPEFVKDILRKHLEH